MKKAEVYNLCRSYRYQSSGYYVSLLAAARGHKPRPSVTAVQDLKSQTIMRIASEDLQELIQKSLAHIQSKEFVLSIYFGQNVAKRYVRLAAQLFSLFQAPLLRASFVLGGKSGKWTLANMRVIGTSDFTDYPSFILIRLTDRYYYPYRQEVTERIEGVVADGGAVCHISLHSFTPELNSEVRKADIGLRTIRDGFWKGVSAACGSICW